MLPIHLWVLLTIHDNVYGSIARVCKKKILRRASLFAESVIWGTVWSYIDVCFKFHLSVPISG